MFISENCPKLRLKTPIYWALGFNEVLSLLLEIELLTYDHRNMARGVP